MKGTATKSSKPFLHEKTFKNSLESLAGYISEGIVRK